MHQKNILKFNLKDGKQKPKTSVRVNIIKYSMIGIAIILFVIDIPFFLIRLISGGIDSVLCTMYNKLLYAADNLEAYHNKNKGV